MTATLNLPVCVRVCEYAKLVSKYALKVSQRIGSLFFFALLFCDFCFYFEREQRSKAALQVCNGPTATAAAIRKIYANCRRQCERRERESAREQEKLKSL